MKVQQKTNRLPKDNELSFFLLKNCPSLADEFPGFSFTCLHGVFFYSEQLHNYFGVAGNAGNAFIQMKGWEDECWRKCWTEKIGGEKSAKPGHSWFFNQMWAKQAGLRWAEEGRACSWTKWLKWAMARWNQVSVCNHDSTGDWPLRAPAHSLTVICFLQQVAGRRGSWFFLCRFKGFFRGLRILNPMHFCLLAYQNLQYGEEYCTCAYSRQ